MYCEQQRLVELPGQYDYETPNRPMQVRGREFPEDTVVYPAPEWSEDTSAPGAGYVLVTETDTTIDGAHIEPDCVDRDSVGLWFFPEGPVEEHEQFEERLIEPWQGPAPNVETLPERSERENE